MKYILSLAMLCVLSLAQSQSQKIPHRYTVSLNKGFNKLKITQGFNNDPLVKILDSINSYGTILSIEFNGELSEEQEIKWLKQNQSIAYFQTVVKMQNRGCEPNDPSFSSQYNMKLMKFDEAWCLKNEGLSPLGDTLVVAVVEFGLNFEDKDLLPNIFINHLEIPDNGIDDDQNGYADDYYGLNAELGGDNHDIDDHGTQVLSVVGAKGNNGIDVSGTNQNIKMLICSSANTPEKLLKCYYYLIEMKRNYLNSGGTRGAFIVSTNLSSGIPGVFPADYPLICQAYDSLAEVGILPSVATINDYADIDFVGDIPGTCPSDYLIVVTSTNRYDKIAVAGFSKKSVDLGACGESIPMINSKGTVDNYNSGTSFASPHIAGAVALLYQYCPKMTILNKTDPKAAVKLMKEFILNCGDNLSDLNGITTTGKRLNMIKSLECLNDYCLSDTIPHDSVSNCSIIIKNNLTNEPVEIVFKPDAFGDYSLVVYNNLGQLINRQTLKYYPGSGNNYSFNIYGWPSGVYHVLIEGQGFKCVKSLIKI